MTTATRQPIKEELGPGLARLASASGVPCGPEEGRALVRYVELLLTWSRSINLTGASSADELLADHLPDSFALAGVLSTGENVVDVGSGGGLPAVPLAVLRPRLRMTLVEPVAKKAAFLRTAVRELGLGTRVSVDARRAEALIAEGTKFDAAMARAVFAPGAWVKVGVQLVGAGGRVLVLASARPSVEVAGVRLRSDCTYLDGRRWLTVLECAV